MPHANKKPRLKGPTVRKNNAASATLSPPPLRRSHRIAGKINNRTQLDVVVEIVFSFLSPKEIMRARCVCKSWKDGAMKTNVPVPRNGYGFEVNTLESFKAMCAMSKAIPNLAQISIKRVRVCEGEDPYNNGVIDVRPRLHNFPDIMPRFRKLRKLTLSDVLFNGRYPHLLNFPLLEKLDVFRCKYLKWDLEMITEMPSLKRFIWCSSDAITGNVKSFIALKEKLEEVCIARCPNVVGNFMDLADFPRLMQLNLESTNVTGDIREMKEHDFAALEGHLYLPSTVIGGMYYQLQSISEASNLMNAIDRIRKCRGGKDDFMFGLYTWSLSNDSPDRYVGDLLDAISFPPPPFTTRFVQAGPRVGWQWKNDYQDCCSINWLDEEPHRDSSEYESYMTDLYRLESYQCLFDGFLVPPTHEEYRLLCERLITNAPVTSNRRRRN